MRRKKVLFNIIFYLFIIILLFITVYINKDYSIIFNKRIIHNEQDLISSKDYKFVTLDMKNATETRFSLSDKGTKSVIYTVTYNNKTILVELSESTVITNNIDVMHMQDISDVNLLKENIKEESEKKLDFYKGYYTNLNLEKNKKIINIKFYISIILGLLCLLLMILNFVSLLVKKI